MALKFLAYLQGIETFIAGHDAADIHIVSSLPTRDWNRWSVGTPVRRLCGFLAYLQGIETKVEAYTDQGSPKFLAYLQGIETFIVTNQEPDKAFCF